MTNSLIATGQFILEIVFNIYILLVMMRFLLQWVKADFYNPICQFLIKVTNPLLVPLRRIIPGFFGLDMAAVVLIYLLQVIFLVLSALMMQVPLMPVILLIAVIQIILLFLNVMFYAILLRAIASWFNPNPYNPLLMILIQLTEPLLLPFRKRLPMFSGMDFSPLVVLILIQVIIFFISSLFGMA
jgi:YggT family protein